MSKPFWVNDYLVDLSRNQISFQDNDIAIPKKALAVLTVLAENSGKVVSHDILMDTVWANSVVAPNTLQRSIAQLRKAFGDDSKQQSMIKTHAKQGYSLAAKVKWLDEDILSTQGESSIFNRYWMILLISLLALVLFITVFFYLKKPPKPVINVSKAVPITATDARETNARYTADGRYLVFHRYRNSYNHHLWAIDLTTKKEYQLTAEPGNYGSHSWSGDGNQLTFVAKREQSFNKKESEKIDENQTCWQIVTLDFAKALKSPQAVVKRSNCKENRVAVARWLTDGNIAVLHKGDTNSHSLQSYHLRNNHLTELYNPEGSELYSYDFSLKSKHFAVVSRNSNNEHIVEKLTIDGKVLSSAFIKLENDNSAHEFYNVYFDPEGEYLLTSTELGLFQLFFDGSMQQIGSLGHRHLADPNLHPNGKNIVAIQESGDQDIAIIDVNKDVDLLAGKAVSIARSNVLDVAGKFQPNGHLIAYVSNRSGSKQIWLYDGNNSRQLTQLDNGLQSMNFVWSPNGDEIATVSGDELVIISLDGSIKTLPSTLLISKVMQWHHSGHLLVLANQNNINNAFELAVDSSKENIIISKKLNLINVEWAQYSNNRDVIYLDSDRKVWMKSLQESSSEPKQINGLINQVGNRRLTLIDNLLYGINDKRQLWHYQLSTQEFTILKQLPASARYISDFNNGKALITQTLRHNKEIIELY
jgi:DNA-binding winged helix-turn-helix (wHTH) protein/dipeptidyl aminopeptidase/acylaminoacyl peptidase